MEHSSGPKSPGSNSPGTEHQAPSAMPGLPVIDVRETGGKKDGEKQISEERLFMQLLVFEMQAMDDEAGDDLETLRAKLADTLREKEIDFVLYQDANSPWGTGVLTWTRSPEDFVEKVLPSIRQSSLQSWQQRHEFTMLGRTYSLGHEPDLEHALFHRPIGNLLKHGWDWAVWYPLRRNGEFEQLERLEQGTILREHASIGMAYGQAELAHDIRLACHGLDANDNEFVIGLIGKDLHPLSHVVQTMRKTKQTSNYIAQMGPFFVGRVIRRSKILSTTKEAT